MPVIKRKSSRGDSTPTREGAAAGQPAPAPDEILAEIDTVTFPFWTSVGGQIRMTRDDLFVNGEAKIALDASDLPRELWLQLLHDFLVSTAYIGEREQLSELRRQFEGTAMARLVLGASSENQPEDADEDDPADMVSVFAGEKLVGIQLLDCLDADWSGVAMCWLLHWLDVDPGRLRQVIATQVRLDGQHL